MPHSYLLVAAGCLGLPFCGLAQRPLAPSPHAPWVYLGAGVSVLTVKPFQRGPEIHSPVGPALTAGVQLSPRLALQASAGLSWRHTLTSTTLPLTRTGPTLTTYTGDEHATLLTLPVLLRYTLAAPTGRLRLDALAGVTLQRTQTELTYSVTEQTATAQTTVRTVGRFGYGQTSLALGPALRYTWQPGFELAVSAPVNYILDAGYSDNASDHLFLQVLAGVHYTFGR